MTKNLASTIGIDASPERVWQVLTDFAAYPEWNPFIVRAEGRPEEGVRLTVRMQPVGARAVTLVPTVLEAVEARRLRWSGSLWIPGIFDAEHVFSLDPPGGRWYPARADRAVPRLSRAAHGPVPRPPHVARIQGHERGAQATGRTRRGAATWLKLGPHAPGRLSPSPGNCWRPRARKPSPCAASPMRSVSGPRPSASTCRTKRPWKPPSSSTDSNRRRTRSRSPPGMQRNRWPPSLRPTARLPQAHPHVYRLMTERPLPRDQMPAGLKLAPPPHFCTPRLAPHGPERPGPSSTA